MKLLLVIASVCALQLPKVNVKPMQVGAAISTAMLNAQMAVAGGQSEGMGLPWGVDDDRETLVTVVIFGLFFTLYYNWAKDQPDSDSDFFGEYDERRL